MHLRILIPLLVVGLVICGMTADPAQAGPFEKAGLSKTTGKVLTDKEADNVRGGFRGRLRGNEEMQAIRDAVFESLGVDTSLSREEIRAQLQEIGREAVREAMQAAMADAGIEPPSFDGERPTRNRAGVRGRQGRMGRRR